MNTQKNHNADLLQTPRADPVQCAANHTRWRVGWILTLGLLLTATACRKSETPDDFLRLTNLGKSHLDRGDAAKAVEVFQQALRLKPTLPDAQLNLANAHLLGNQAEPAISMASKVLEVDPNSAAALYVIGCANLRLGRNEEALKALQQSQRIDPAVTAVNFQLGLAHERLGQFDEAIAQWQTAIEFEPNHAAAHYRLSQVLLRAGRQDEANEQLALHQAALTKRGSALADVSTFERCKHTQARLPFKAEEPLKVGIRVTFTDVTANTLSNAAGFQGPVAILDLAHDGRNHLFAREGEGFRLLINDGQGRFTPQGSPLPGVPGARYRKSLVGDLQNDRFEDVIVLGENAGHVFKFATNAGIAEVTRFAGLKDLSGIDGALVDFDFTGKLGLMALQTNGALRVYRNLGNFYFSQTGVTSGLPATVEGARQLVLDDWNGDDLMDVMLPRGDASPSHFAKQRGGPFAPTNPPVSIAAAATMASADLNNDLRPDLVTAGKNGIEVNLGGNTQRQVLSASAGATVALALVDYDNDGWLDVLAVGEGLRMWRNLGSAGFRESTADLGLTSIHGARVVSVDAADIDGDCDTDLVLAMDGGGLRFLRNEGGNAHRQLKLRLLGTRSNASGLGIRLEVSAGGLRALRTVNTLPIELGVGKHTTIDSVAVRWFDGLLNNDEIKLEGCSVLTLEELQLPTGSCPYLYAWDGTGFRFVTDLLGASPLGLRVSDTRFVDADPREYVWIGSESMFPRRGSNYVLQVTEELREVLYLDEAKLVIVDHPADTEVHSTSKLRPGKPFTPHELVTLHRPKPLRNALDLSGRNVTRLLEAIDQRMVSPARLRPPQVRGLAEPHGVILDFGPLDSSEPLVLALTGWLRFGGGMANVAGSHNPDYPFPFPQLEAEIGGQDGTQRWVPVDVVTGTPAGKTKTILVDLDGKLPSGARRLRITTAFELHWDRIAVFERRDNTSTTITTLPPVFTDLHWRGYSEFQPLPWDLPLTPDYRRVNPTANWPTTPFGWCTRYGSVNELVGAEDNSLALLNGGDELTLQFDGSHVATPQAGKVRDFFFYSVGWDKDADFHCELGYQVDPLPWHGMDDQLYGKQPRPTHLNEDWMRKYNTRWVGPRTLTRSDLRR